MLNNSIISCFSAEVRTGIGGSGRAKALFKSETESIVLPT